MKKITLKRNYHLFSVDEIKEIISKIAKQYNIEIKNINVESVVEEDQGYYAFWSGNLLLGIEVLLYNDENAEKYFNIIRSDLSDVLTKMTKSKENVLVQIYGESKKDQDIWHSMSIDCDNAQIDLIDNLSRYKNLEW